MSTKTLSGFFYISGGIDRPVGYDDNLKFGFHNDNGVVVGPDFKYSLNSVIKFFNEPIAITELSKDVNKTNNVLTILIDGLVGTNAADYENISDDQFDALKIEELFKALEYLNNNQGIISNYSVDNPIAYSCVGDEYLQKNIPSYVKTSLIITESVIQHRVSKITFEFVYSENPDLSKNIGAFEFYFTPDDMYIDHGLDFGKYTVVEDIYNYQYIDPNIVNPLKPFKDVPLKEIADPEILKDYSNYVTFKTTHVLLLQDGTVDKSVTQQFFILHNMCPGSYIPLYKQIIIVKQYLIFKYASDFVLLKKIYPDLFSDSFIDIYPLMYNTVKDKIDVSRSDVITPVRIVDIVDEMRRRGIPTVGLGLTTTNVEVFLIDGLSIYDENALGSTKDELFRIPLLSVDNSSVPTAAPIGAQYPGFTVRAAGMPIVGADWEVFQFYVKLFVRILLGMNPGNFSDKTDPELAELLGVPNNFGLSTTKFSLFGVNYLNSITFIFNGVEFTVHGYNYGEIHDYQ